MWTTPLTRHHTFTTIELCIITHLFSGCSVFDVCFQTRDSSLSFHFSFSRCCWIYRNCLTNIYKTIAYTNSRMTCMAFNTCVVVVLLFFVLFCSFFLQRSNGASLICLHEQNERNSDRYHYYVLYGLLAWTNDSTNIDHPHLFTNIFNYRYWLEKRLKIHVWHGYMQYRTIKHKILIQNMCVCFSSTLLLNWCATCMALSSSISCAFDLNKLVQLAVPFNWICWWDQWKEYTFKNSKNSDLELESFVCLWVWVWVRACSENGIHWNNDLVFYLCHSRRQ